MRRLIHLSSFISCFVFGWLCTIVSAQSDSKPGYRRVFVPQSDLLRILQSEDFVPWKTSQLEELLASDRATAEEQFAVQRPYLDRTLLLANLVGNDLVSDQSKLTIVYANDARDWIHVQPLALALRPPTSVPAGARPVINYSSLVPLAKGGVKLPVDETSDWWFGWSLHGKQSRDGRVTSFRTKIPRAIDTKLLMRLPRIWSVESDRYVVRRVDEFSPELIAELPSDWLGNKKDFESFWILELGGTELAEFDLRRTEESVAIDFPNVAQDFVQEYFVRPSGVMVTTSWKTPRDPMVPKLWQMETIAGVQPTLVELDGVQVDWEYVGPDAFRPILKADDLRSSLGEGTSLATNTWKVITYAPWLRSTVGGREEPVSKDDMNWSNHQRGSFPWILPKIELLETYVTNGRTTFEIDPAFEFQGTELLADGRSENLASSSGFSDSRSVEWTGKVPSIAIRLGRPTSKLEVQTITQLRPMSDAIAATTAVEVEGKAEPISAITAKLAPGWVLESISSLSTDITVNSRILGVDSEGQEIELAFSPAVSSRKVYIELRSRNAGQGNNASIRELKECQVLLVKDSTQRDVYAIETAAAFSLVVDNRVLRCQTSREGLTSWQDQRLPRLGNVWILRPIGGKLPSLSFVQQPASYNLDVVTQAGLVNNRIVVHYTFRVTPISGSVQRLRLRLGNRIESDLRWRLAKLQDAAPSQIDVRTESDGDDKGNLELILEKPMAEPFELIGTQSWAFSPPFPFQLPMASDAIGVRGKVILDRSLDMVTQDDRLMIDPEFGTQGTDSDRGRGFRYDPAQQLALQVQMIGPRVLKMQNDIPLEVDHYVTGNGQICHRIRMALQNLQVSSLRWKVPKEWMIVAATLGGTRVDVVNEDGMSSISYTIGSNAVAGAESSLDIVYLDDRIIGPRGSTVSLAVPDVKIPTSVVEERLHLHRNWVTKSLGRSDISARYELPRLDTGREILPSMIGSLEKDQSSAWSTFVLAPQGESELSEASRVAEEFIFRRVQVFPKIQFEAFAAVLGIASVGFGIFLFRRIGFRLLLIASSAYFIACFLEGSLREFVFRLSVGLLVAVLVGWVGRLLDRKTQADRSSVMLSGSRSASALFSRFVLGTALISSLMHSSIGRAQSTVTSDAALSSDTFDDAAERESRVDRSESTIIIPIDGNGNPTSSYSYVPRRFLEALLGSQGANNDRSNAGSLLSSRYQLSLQSTGLAGVGSEELTALFEFQVDDVKTAIRLPFSQNQVRLIRFSVNELDVPIGGRLRWTEGGQSLIWNPDRTGRVRVRCVFQPLVQILEADRRQSVVTIPPIENAILEVQYPTENVTDVDIDSLGQIVNPASGRFVASIGPTEQLNVSWRRTNEKRRNEPLSWSGDCRLNLEDSSPKATLGITLTGSLSSITAVNIECPSDWRPIGVRWGAGRIVATSPGSSLGKRRYRVLLDDVPANASSEPSIPPSRRIETIWIPERADAKLLSLPQMELVGVRAKERLLILSEREGEFWQVEGIVGWTNASQEALKQIIGDAIESDRAVKSIPENGSQALLRRKSQSKLASVRCNSTYGIHSSVLQYRFEMTWLSSGNQPASIDLLLPSELKIDAINVNGKSSRYFDSKDSDGRRHCHIPVISEFLPIETISLETSLRNTDQDWQDFPTIFPVGVEVVEHSLSATKSTELAIDVESLEAWPDVAEVSEELWSTSLRQFHEPLWQRRLPVKSSPDGSLNGKIPRYKIRVDADSATVKVWTIWRQVAGRWTVQIEGVIENCKTLGVGLTLEVPTGLAGSLEFSCDHLNHLIPETKLDYVYLLPRVDRLGLARFRIQGFLDNVSAGSFSPPEIRVLSELDSQQFVSVPKMVDNRVAIWNATGLDEFQPSETDFSSTELFGMLENRLQYSHFRKMSTRSTLSYMRELAEKASAELVSATHALDLANGKIYMRSQFWVEPRGANRFEVEYPSALKIMACKSQQVTADYRLDQGILQISCRPNNLPVLLEVHSEFNLASDDEAVSVPLPGAETFEEASVYWQFQQSNSTRDWVVADPNAEFMDTREWLMARCRTGIELLQKATSRLTDLDESQTKNWFSPWERELEDLLFSFIAAPTLESDQVVLSVFENSLWEGAVDDLASLRGKVQKTLETRSSVRPDIDLSDFECGKISGESRQLRIEARSRSTWSKSLLLIMTFWLVAVFGLHWLFTKNDAGQFFEKHPWWGLVLVAVLLLIVVPGYWMSVLWAILAVYSVIQTWIFYHKHIRRTSAV